MFFLWFLGIVSSICSVFGVWDQQCVDNCSCCIDEQCAHYQSFSNGCVVGCIDGHRGARCYELCQYENCKSCGGLTPSKECTICYDGYYLGPNKNCTSQCPSNCESCSSSSVSALCTKCKEGFYDKDGSTTCKYAYCPVNCECNDQGDCVSCKLGYYETSGSCTKQCPGNCLACVSEESCNECKNGFHNDYRSDNNVNVQLNNCTYACRDTCIQCQSYNNCSECINGKYGSSCQEDCSVGCKDKTCTLNSGRCECFIDFTGDTCMKCVDGKYGSFCNETCSDFCKGKRCEKMSSFCSDGCINENFSGSTCNICSVGMFDELCDKMCPNNCKDDTCERKSGVCSDGCTSNFDGTMCDLCISGFYGKECELTCPVNCANNSCDRNSGICDGCIGNFQGEMCDECKPGFYGQNCDVTCPQHCANYPCHRNTGNCVYGCKHGYSGDKCCVMSEHCVECYSSKACKTCISGFFKSSCNETCPGSCTNSCDISTGKCKESKQQKEACPVATAAVLGSLFALSFVVNIVQLALSLLKKIKVSRRNHSKLERDPAYEHQLQSVEDFRIKIYDASDTAHSEDLERNVYEGISSFNENEHEYQQVSQPRGGRP